MPTPFQLLKTVLFSLTVPGVVAGLIPWVLARADSLEFPLESRLSDVLGVVSLVSGLVLYAHTAWRFADEGEGTPAPVDEPEELVAGGVYAHVRNPMYVAVVLCVVGQALLYRSLFVCWWAAGCALGFHNRVVGYEEPHLREKHGETFERYCERVPRWLPRLS
ncbi:methyltransferase family protein [Natronobiforma cellulositropha]|uniref:methyltransferase family protein n=1 Tax=Natronobiforma cellulositropha TaxID=1679076 RepID=UPI0021D59D0F|nr:isoprenylcysteine carboxylmethyltransferase family protein [Natronobiforma cellulositropha]